MEGMEYSHRKNSGTLQPRATEHYSSARFHIFTRFSWFCHRPAISSTYRRFITLPF